MPLGAARRSAREEPIMPFEGDVADFTKVAIPVETPEQSIIRRAREMLADREHWIRNWQSGDAFCILGALRHAHHGSAWTPGTGGAQDYVMRVLKRFGYTGITTFNDRHATHTQVLIVLDAAYDLAAKPRRAKLDRPQVSRVRAYFGHDMQTGEPLPPPLHYSSLRPTVADVIEHVIPMQRATWAERLPDPAARTMAPALERALETPLRLAARLGMLGPP
jgi:hypothetical protein